MNNYIDQNNKNVGIAELPDSVEKTFALLVNPLTDELFIEIIPNSDVGTITSNLNIPLDDNGHQISAVVTDDANETITPLTVDMIQNIACLRIEI